MLWILLSFILASPVQAEVYLCPTDGDGSEANPYRSRALSELLPGRGNVDLRDNTTQPGMMLCESDSLPANIVGVVSIGADRTSPVRPQTRAAIITATNGAVNGGTVEAIVKELVIPRLPAPKAGKGYEIILSPSRPPVKEVASLSNDLYYKGLAAVVKERGLAAVAAVIDSLQPAIAWATILATETFNCADADSLTCVHTWADKSGSAINIVSNQASATSVSTATSYAVAPVTTTDHEVAVTLVSASLGGGSTVGCSVLGRTTNDATATFYRTLAELNSGGELNQVILSKVVAGTVTTLATDTTDWSANDVLAVRMIGTTISSRKNGVQILSTTDASISTGLYGGLRHFSATGTTPTCTWDNWSMKDVSSRRKVTPWFN